MNALPSIPHSFYCSLTSSSFPFIFQDSASFSISDLIIALDSPSSEVPHLPLATDGHFYFHSPAGTQDEGRYFQGCRAASLRRRAACNLDLSPYHWTHRTYKSQSSFLCALKNHSLSRVWCCEAAPHHSPALWVSPDKGSGPCRYRKCNVFRFGFFVISLLQSLLCIIWLSYAKENDHHLGVLVQLFIFK